MGLRERCKVSPSEGYAATDVGHALFGLGLTTKATRA